MNSDIAAALEVGKSTVADWLSGKPKSGNRARRAGGAPPPIWATKRAFGSASARAEMEGARQWQAFVLASGKPRKCAALATLGQGLCDRLGRGTAVEIGRHKAGVRGGGTRPEAVPARQRLKPAAIGARPATNLGSRRQISCGGIHLPCFRDEKSIEAVEYALVANTGAIEHHDAGAMDFRINPELTVITSSATGMREPWFVTQSSHEPSQAPGRTRRSGRREH